MSLEHVKDHASVALILRLATTFDPDLVDTVAEQLRQQAGQRQRSCAFLTMSGRWMPDGDVSDDAKLLDRGAHRPSDGRTFAVPVERSCSTRRIDHIPQRCARYLDILVETMPAVTT